MATRYSKVKVRGEDDLKQVEIGTLKPKIVKVVTNKWQALIDTAANICNVPSGLITQLKEEHLEVFLNSSNEDNPIKATDTFELGFGHYCEKLFIMSQNQIEHLFKYKIRHQKTGTEGEKSAGIGLLLVKEFLIKNEVQLSVESTINVGTKFKLNFTTNNPRNKKSL